MAAQSDGGPPLSLSADVETRLVVALRAFRLEILGDDLLCSALGAADAKVRTGPGLLALPALSATSLFDFPPTATDCRPRQIVCEEGPRGSNVGGRTASLRRGKPLRSVVTALPNRSRPRQTCGAIRAA